MLLRQPGVLLCSQLLPAQEKKKKKVNRPSMVYDCYSIPLQHASFYDDHNMVMWPLGVVHTLLQHLN